jgi:hypothetical protein
MQILQANRMRLGIGKRQRHAIGYAFGCVVFRNQLIIDK